MAHGAKPHDGVDAITIAVASINEVQKVISREMPSDDRAILTISTISGGEAINIICFFLALTGTTRTSYLERRELLVQRVREIGVATMHPGEAEFSYRSGEPAVVNDAGMVERFRRLVVETAGQDRFVAQKSVTGSDDFGFYSACVPSIYFWLAAKSRATSLAPHVDI